MSKATRWEKCRGHLHRAEKMLTTGHDVISTFARIQITSDSVNFNAFRSNINYLDRYIDPCKFRSQDEPCRFEKCFWDPKQVGYKLLVDTKGIGVKLLNDYKRYAEGQLTTL